jgi:DNA replication protein DnaC
MQLMKGAAVEMRTEQTVQNKELEQLCQQILANTTQKKNGQTWSDTVKKTEKTCHGFDLYEEDGIVYAEPTEEYVREMKAKRLSFACIPHMYEKARFRHLSTKYYKEDMTEVFQKLKDYTANFENAKKEGVGLYLWSAQKGSGKTMSVCALANELLENDYQVRFATSARILQEIRNTYSNTTTYTESQMMSDLKTCELLIIDDFGVEKITDWVREKMYEIINERYLANRPTIFTANNDIKDLPYDERITNRIEQMCVAIHYPEVSVRSAIGKLRQNFLDKFKKG